MIIRNTVLGGRQLAKERAFGFVVIIPGPAYKVRWFNTIVCSFGP